MGRRGLLPVAVLCGLVFLSATHCAHAFWETNSNADLGFDSFYTKPSHIGWGWLWAAVFAIGAAAIVFFSGGTGTPVVAGIGMWIGNAAGLAGAAATNFGLALLGGGSIAAGGFGMAGGAALLTAALSFTTDIVINYSMNTVTEQFDSRRFVEQTKDLMVLPLPRNDEGPRAYHEAMKIVDQRYHWDRPRSDEENQNVAHDVLAKVSDSGPSGARNLRDRQRSGVLQALSLLQLSRYDEAREVAEDVIRSFVIKERAENPAMQGQFTGDDYIGIALDPQFRAVSRAKITLPLAIWGESALSTDNIDVTRGVRATCAAVGLEPGSPLVPLLVGSELGFLSARQDRLDPAHFAMLRGTLEEHVKEEKTRIPSLQLLWFGA